MAYSREHTIIPCKLCGKQMSVRNDYVKYHTEICTSCRKTGNSYARKHGAYKTRLYHIWVGLSHRRYKYKPVICDEWHSFEPFKKWAEENGYSDSLTIDRIDSKKGYSPDNCQWISHAENSGKDKRIFTGEEKVYLFHERKQLGFTQVEMAKKYGVSRKTIQRVERWYKNELVIKDSDRIEV